MYWIYSSQSEVIGLFTITHGCICWVLRACEALLWTEIVLPVIYMSVLCQWKSCCSLVTCIIARWTSLPAVKLKLCPQRDAAYKHMKHCNENFPYHTGFGDIEIYTHVYFVIGNRYLWTLLEDLVIGKKTGLCPQLYHHVTGLKTTTLVTAAQWSILYVAHSIIWTHT